MIDEPKKNYLDTVPIRPEDPRTSSFYHAVQEIGWYDINQVVQELHTLLKNFHALTLYSYTEYDDQDGYSGSACYRIWGKEPEEEPTQLDLFFGYMRSEAIKEDFLRDPTDQNLKQLVLLISKIDSKFEDWLRDIDCDHVTLAWDPREAKAHFVDTPPDY